MKLWLVLVTLVASAAHAGPIGPACDARIMAAAREAFAKDSGKGDLKYLDDGITTSLPKDNWTSAKLAFGNATETRVYLVSARQAGTSGDCRVASSLLIETRPLTVDRGPIARALAGAAPADGLLRALEQIDLEYPRIARVFPRSAVTLDQGTPATAINEVLTFTYRFGWGECAETCEKAHTLTVRYARGFTAPQIQIVAELGDALPSEL